MLEIALTLIMGFGLGRIGDVLVKERRRKKRLNALVGKTVKKARRTKKEVVHAETDEQSVKSLLVFQPSEGEVSMDKDDIKEKIRTFFEDCDDPVMPYHVAKEIELDEEATISALDELVDNGLLQQEGGLYGRKMETSIEQVDEEIIN